MELSALEELLTAENLEESRKPLKESEKKRRFLRAFLLNHCKVVETLSAEGVDPEELLVWRSTDSLFDSLYRHYEKLANADLAAAMRHQARNSDDPKVQAAVLASLDPEYNTAVTKEREKAKLKGPQAEPDLATFGMEQSPSGEIKVKDPVAAIASTVIDNIPVVPTTPLVSDMQAPQLSNDPDDAIRKLVQESIQHCNGTEFVKFFRPRDDF